MYELVPRYDTRQSFYRKAMVNDVYGDESVLDYEDHVNTDFSTYKVESLESEAE